MRLTPCLFVLSRPTVYDMHHLTCMFSSQSFVKAQMDRLAVASLKHHAERCNSDRT